MLMEPRERWDAHNNESGRIANESSYRNQSWVMRSRFYAYYARDIIASQCGFFCAAIPNVNACDMQLMLHVCIHSNLNAGKKL